MDVADYAQQAQERQETLARQRIENRPPQAVELSDPECIDCGVDITARRQIVPHALRCVDCQNDHDKRKR
jgi:RNA polymerase-binding transcription factor DksA